MAAYTRQLDLDAEEKARGGSGDGRAAASAAAWELATSARPAAGFVASELDDDEEEDQLWHRTGGDADDDFVVAGAEEDEEDDPLEPASWSQQVKRWGSRQLREARSELKSLRAWARSCWVGQVLATKYVAADCRRDKRSVGIGVFTVLLVVMLVVLLENNVARAPLIFWRMAENSVGETDLLLTPGAGISGIQSLAGESVGGGLTDALVHQSFVNARLGPLQSAGVLGSSGRWVLLAKVLQGNSSATAAARVVDPSSSYANASETHVASSFVLGINSATESSIGVGRQWSLPPLVGQSAYITRSVIREIGLDPTKAVGAEVLLRLDLLDVAQTLDVGGIGGGSDASGDDPDNNSTIPASAERARAESEGSDLTPEQQRALLLRELIEVALPQTKAMWSRPVDLGNNTALVIAFLEYLNATLSGADAGASGGLIPFPLPPTPWVPGDPIPPEIQPLLDVLAEQYGIVLTPEQIEQLIASIFQNAEIAPPGGLSPGDAAQAAIAILDSGVVVLDPLVIQEHLIRLRNGTETYGDLLALATPFLLQILRVDTAFTVAGVVDEPEGKWSTALGSVMVLENDELMRVLSSGIVKILALENQVNMSAPLLPPGAALPDPSTPGMPPLPVPVPNDAYQWPLERLISFLFPSVNASTIHQGAVLMESFALGVRSSNFSLMSVVQYTGRLNVYLQSLDEMNADLLRFTDAVSAQGVGFDAAFTYLLPVAQAMTLTVYAKYFLDNIMAAVLALLILLGMMLIYSLLLNDADSRTYEMGMLRAMGMKRRTLVQLLLTRSALFSIAGISIGLLLAFIANAPLAKYLADFAAVPADYALLATPLLVAMTLGLVLPLVSNIVPISRALSKSLRDSLDVYHASVSEVRVRMIRLEELGISPWQTALSVLMLVTGFVCFYIIPWAFTFKLFPVFLGTLMAVLLGMLLGLCILAQIVQPYMERALLRAGLYLVWPHRKLYSIVAKNLAAHKGRNAKTAQMFLISLSFLVFAGTMFNLQSASLADNLKMFNGADIQIAAPLRAPDKFRLAEKEMREVLDEAKTRAAKGEAGQIVEDYSFVSYGLNALIPVSRVSFSSLPEVSSVRQTVWGIEPNLLEVCYAAYLAVASVDTTTLPGHSVPHTPDGEVDVVRLMLNNAGSLVLPEEQGRSLVPMDLASAPSVLSIAHSINETAVEDTIRQSYVGYLDVLISEALHGAQSVTIGTPLRLSVTSNNDDLVFYSHYLAKPRALLVKMPGFLFSSYRQTAAISSVLVGMDHYERVMRDVYATWTAPRTAPKQKLFIRVLANATRDQREDLVNALRPFFKGDQTKTQVLDTRSLLSSMDSAMGLMDLFFTLTGAIAMLLCFFLLYLSFTANVEENSWEFAVLRAVGLNGVEVVALYVYEALALVLSSVLLGTFIGASIAATLTLQFNLFMELPFRFRFPTTVFTSMVCMALVVAVAGSALPAYKLLRKSISTVLRRQ